MHCSVDEHDQPKYSMLIFFKNMKNVYFIPCPTKTDKKTAENGQKLQLY
jgi:hypothetical protein